VSQQGPYHVAGYSRVSWQYGGVLAALRDTSTAVFS
jgi:hypothetical protein